ncbi:MAG: cell division protein FtsQ/DivIB [Deltaproteobacteria bacterium]
MAKQKKASKRPILAILLILMIMVAFYSFLHSSLFVIEKVYTVGAQAVSGQEIIKFSGIKKGINIFDIDSEASEKAITIIPRIKTADVVRHLPSQIEIRVTERKPWALILAKDKYFIIDKEGVCLQKLQMFELADLPIITLARIPARINEGQQLGSKDIVLLNKVISAMPPELAGTVSEYHCTADGQVYIYTLNGIEVRLGGADRLAEKIQVFDEAMKLDKKSTKQKLSYIDLRYEGQPVVRYKHR